MLGCWRGCDKRAVLAAVGLTMGDLFDPESKRNDPAPRRKEVKAYPYLDERGVVLFEKVRYEPKAFAFRVPDKTEKTGYRWVLGDVRRILYRTNELAADSNAHRLVVVVEGEKDADTLANLGMLATTDPDGAGFGADIKWRPEYSQQLKGRHACVVPDNEPTGYRRAYAVLGSLVAHGAASVRYVTLPDSDDVTDYLARRGNTPEAVEGFKELIRFAPVWRCGK